MEKKKHLFIFLILMGGIWGCRGTQQKNGESAGPVIPFTSVSGTSAYDYVDSVYYLKLQDREEALLAEVDKLICREGKIYLGDFSNHKIVVYDTTGAFRYVIDRRGRGAGEYQQIKSFAVGDTCLYILDTFLPGLHVYDNRTGAFLSRKETSFFAWDFELLSQGCFLFTYCTFKGDKPLQTQPPCRLLVTDGEMNIVAEMLPFDELGDPIGKEIYFTSSDKKIIYHWWLNDSFMVIDKETPDSLKFFTVDFGSQQIPEVYRHDYELLGDAYNYIGRTPLLNGNYIAIEVVKGDRVDCYLYHIPSRKLLGNPTDETLPYFPFPDACDTRGRFVEVLTNKVWYEEHIKSGFPRADAAIESHLEEGMALVIYKMKD